MAPWGSRYVHKTGHTWPNLCCWYHGWLKCDHVQLCCSFLVRLRTLWTINVIIRLIIGCLKILFLIANQKVQICTFYTFDVYFYFWGGGLSIQRLWLILKFFFKSLYICGKIVLILQLMFMICTLQCWYGEVVSLFWSFIYVYSLFRNGHMLNRLEMNKQRIFKLRADQVSFL